MVRLLLASLLLLPSFAWAQGLDTSLDTGLDQGPDSSLDHGPRSVHSVLYFMDDDIGDTTRLEACGGDCSVNMPTLDTLRTNGISFSNFYVTPACASTRASALTGRHPFQHGMETGAALGYLPRNELEIPEAIRMASASFKTGMFGKLGLQSSSEASYTYALMGFDRFWGGLSSLAGDWYNYSSSEGDYPFAMADITTEGGNSNPITANSYKGEGQFDEAVEWIDSLADGQKFILFMWTNQAHNGNPHEPPLTEGAGPPDGNPNSCDTADTAVPGDNCATLQVRNADGKLGDVLTAALAHDSSTLVIYHMDNGDAYRGTYGKGDIQEGGIKGEMILAYGDIPACGSPPCRGNTETEKAQVIDIFPTIMDYAGIDNTPFTDRRGFSLRNIVSGTCTEAGRRYGNCWDGTAERTIYSADANFRTLVGDGAATDGYKYIVEDDGAAEGIYEIAVSEASECSDSPCLAAKAILEVALPAYDGLPAGP